MSDLQARLPIKEVVLITSGDLRQSANQVCWPAQEELERKLTKCFLSEGVTVRRAFQSTRIKGMASSPASEWAWIFLRASIRQRISYLPLPHGNTVITCCRDAQSQGANPDGRELVRQVARACRLAKPERISD